MGDQPDNDARSGPEESRYIETEAKFEVAQEQLERVRAQLIELGASLIASRETEDNELFDFEDGRLRVSGCALRLRSYGQNHLLTFKGPVQPDPHLKMREELESAVSSERAIRLILLQIGLRVSFRYSKVREIYNLRWSDATVQVCLDETPVGVFVEIEGAAQAIHELAGRFGFSEYIRQSYIDLYTERTRGL